MSRPIAALLLLYAAFPASVTQAQHVPDATAAGAPGSSFSDCSGCPTMVVVPAGSFTMGSTQADIDAYRDISTAGDEGPQHKVMFAAPFALGKFEVTRGQFRLFVAETGYRFPSDNCMVWTGSDLLRTPGNSWEKLPFAQTDDHPVVCLTQADAQAYIDWLVRKTGHAYRLPSEAEWEYAERAGSTTLYPFGDDARQLCDYGNVNDQSSRDLAKDHEAAYAQWSFAECRDGFARTAPVGSFKPNAFGLHDMIGNVWERLEDCKHTSYVGAPTDGSAWIEGGDCNFRQMRGSGWRNRPQHYRAANRVATYHTASTPTLSPGTPFAEPWGGFNYYGDYVGFRVAMSMSAPAKIPVAGTGNSGPDARGKPRP